MKAEEPPKPLTLKAYLVGELRMEIGDITLTEKDTIEAFATAAYKKAQGTLKRLMQPKWSVEVVDAHGSTHRFGLDKWNKLLDGEQMLERQREAFKREMQRKAKQMGLRA